MKRIGPLIILILLLCGCATWKQRSVKFDRAIAAGNYESAEKIIDKEIKDGPKRNEVLYLLNLGYVQFMLNSNVESNATFSKVERMIETQINNPLNDAAALLTNPEVKPYRPEDFEVVMINVYKALNYLRLNDLSGALVEARRMNIRLQQLNSKYANKSNKYQKDAFAHLLMGIIYDASREYNDAFIAYRNAFDIYQKEYTEYFNTTPPEQLKQDMVRTAYLSGLMDQYQIYKEQFNIEFTEESEPEDVVGLWFNGEAPYKSEWGINFIADQSRNGFIVFNNAEYGLSFPFPIPSNSSKESIKNIQTVRVAFPKLVEIKSTIQGASLNYANKNYLLEPVENINNIAFSVLRDRMVREMGTSLLRLAIKQSVKYVASKQNDWLGLAVGIANALTEKADTRYWQTLPHSIGYCRFPYSNSLKTVNFIPSNSMGQKVIALPTSNNKTKFIIVTTR